MAYSVREEVCVRACVRACVRVCVCACVCVCVCSESTKGLLQTAWCVLFVYDCVRFLCLLMPQTTSHLL